MTKQDSAQAIIYHPHVSIPQLNESDKLSLIHTATIAIKDFFSGKNELPDFPSKYDSIDNRVYVILRKDGQRKGSWYTRENNLAKTVYMATLKNLRKNKLKPTDAGDLKIHIQVMGDYLTFDENYEHGVHGIRVTKDGKGANYYSSYAIEGNYKLSKLKTKIMEKAGLKHLNFDDPTVDKFYFPSLHFGTTRFTSDSVVTFYRGSSLAFYDVIDSSLVSESLDMANRWLLRSLTDTGKFNYRYFPSSGKYSSKNNMIRQLMASRVLAELASADESLLEAHRRNLRFIFKNWYKENGHQGFISFNNKSKLGATAMALRVLVYSPLFNEYKERAQKLVNTLLFLQKNDGSWEPWYQPPAYPYDEDYLLTFYSGEAILSLVEYYKLTCDEEVLRAASLSQNFYIHRYVTNMESNYYPAYVPWHTMSIYHLYLMKQEKRYAEAVFKMNDKLLKIQNLALGPWPDIYGRFFNPAHPEFGTPHVSSDAVYFEGLTYALEVAHLERDSARIKRYQKAVLAALQNLLHLQCKDADLYYLHYPYRVKGAFRTNVIDNRIRIDNTQHSIDALNRVIGLFSRGQL